MIQNAMDVLRDYPVRKSKKQKQIFREDVQHYAAGLGYDVHLEKTGLNGKNIVIGKSKTAKYLITAHYDTCARLPFPNFITPCNLGLYLGYQLLIVVIMIVFMALFTAAASLVCGNPSVTFWMSYLVLLAFLYLLIFGPANKHNSNDNTSGVVSVLAIAESLPENLRDQVCFVLFDFEEAGLIGSYSYRSKHKEEIKNQIILNLDCVGDGDEIYCFPTNKLRKDETKMSFLRRMSGSFGQKSVTIREKGFSFYPSDQANFPYGVGICALHRHKSCLYMSRIHTNRDTVLEEENVNILCRCLIDMICSSAVENKKGF